MSTKCKTRHMNWLKNKYLSVDKNGKWISISQILKEFKKKFDFTIVAKTFYDYIKKGGWDELRLKVKTYGIDKSNIKIQEVESEIISARGELINRILQDNEFDRKLMRALRLAIALGEESFICEGKVFITDKCQVLFRDIETARKNSETTVLNIIDVKKESQDDEIINYINNLSDEELLEKLKMEL